MRCSAPALGGGAGQVLGCVSACVRARGKPIPFLVEDFPPQELTKQHKTLSNVLAQAILRLNSIHPTNTWVSGVR